MVDYVLEHETSPPDKNEIYVKKTFKTTKHCQTQQSFEGYTEVKTIQLYWSCCSEEE